MKVKSLQLNLRWFFFVCFPLAVKIGDKSCSSHSSSNTLSSNTSSNSDEKHFGSGDLMDPELLGLTYIKGASTDSGIDTAPCMSAPLLAPLHLAGSRSGVHCRTEQWTESSETPGLDEDSAKMYAVHSYASAISASHMAEGSMGDLSEISSHSRYVFLKNLGFCFIDGCSDIFFFWSYFLCFSLKMYLTDIDFCWIQIPT